MSAATPVSQFYTGLVAELYEPLASYHASADEYAPFIDRSGQPVLELACGSGLPLLELVCRGYDVDGLDASPDMLARCRERAAAQGLSVTLHQQEMQAMELQRRYRSIYLAGASFNLLASDDDARETLRRMRDHLLPGGGVLIPLERPDVDAIRRSLGLFREAEDREARIRVSAIDVHADERERLVCTRLRYERSRPDGTEERIERDWVMKWWDQETFRAMLQEAGFARVTAIRPDGRTAPADSRSWVFLAGKDE